MDTRLDWHNGMELTPETFIESDNIEYQYMMLLRKIVASKVYGLIPNVKTVIDWYIENDMIIINSLKFHSLTRSGNILSVDLQDEKLSIPSNHLANDYYITVELSEESEKFTQNGIYMIKQGIVCGVKTINDIKEPKSSNAIPFGKIKPNQENYVKDDHYVPPIISINSSLDLRGLIDKININIGDIVSHQYFSSQGNDLIVTIIQDKIKNYNTNSSPESFMRMSHGFIIVLANYVFKEKIQEPQFDTNDIMIWFSWFLKLTDEALHILESTIVEEPVTATEEPETDELVIEI